MQQFSWMRLCRQYAVHVYVMWVSFALCVRVYRCSDGYVCAWIWMGICAFDTEDASYKLKCIFAGIARITKQLSAFKLKRLKCTLQIVMCTWNSLKWSNSKIIFIQIAIKTCSGNYDPYNSKCKCAMNRLWRFAHAFHFEIAWKCTCVRWSWRSTHIVYVLAWKSWTWHFGCVDNQRCGWDSSWPQKNSICVQCAHRDREMPLEYQDHCILLIE